MLTRAQDALHRVFSNLNTIYAKYYCAVQVFSVTGQTVIAHVQLMYDHVLSYENRQSPNLSDFPEIWTVINS